MADNWSETLMSWWLKLDAYNIDQVSIQTLCMIIIAKITVHHKRSASKVVDVNQACNQSRYEVFTIEIY